MAKQSGLGDQLYVAGYNLSGDVGSLGSVHGGPAALDVTAINKSAPERIGGVRDGGIEFGSWFNPAAGQEHTALKGLPTADVVLTYGRGSAVGSPGACMTAKQVNYDFTRAADGALSLAVSAVPNGFGLEWGVQLTAGLRADTTATSPATGYDTGAAASFGGQAYLNLVAFTGTSVAVKIQDSADNASFADISPTMLFTTVTAAPAFERIAIVNTSTIRRYVRVITTGTFTVATFSVVLVKNEAAGVVF